MDQYNILLKSRQSKTYTSSGHVYIFSSLITCPICGCKFSGRQRKRTRADGSIYCDTRYNCMGKFKYHSGASLRESAIEKYLLDHIDTALQDALIEYDLALNAQPKSTKSVRSLKDELSRLNTMYQKGRISEEYYESEYEKLSSAISGADSQEIELKQKKLLSVAHKFQGNWKELYSKLDNTHKKAFWKQIIEEINVDPDTRQISGFKFLL